MANDPNKPRPGKRAGASDDTGTLLNAELRRRGMTQTEIDSTLRKKKRRKVLEFNVVKSRHLMDDPRAAPGSRTPRRAAYREPRGRISAELCTVDDAAAQLNLHPRTVLRFIHDQRLPATRIGKSYRIQRADLEAFAGLPAVPQVSEAPSVTAIIDIPDVAPDLARKWARTVTGALGAKPAGQPPLRADVVHDPERAHLKIVIVGSPGAANDLLSLIRVWLNQLT